MCIYKIYFMTMNTKQNISAPRNLPQTGPINFYTDPIKEVLEYAVEHNLLRDHDFKKVFMSRVVGREPGPRFVFEAFYDADSFRGLIEKTINHSERNALLNLLFKEILENITYNLTKIKKINRADRFKKLTSRFLYLSNILDFCIAMKWKSSRNICIASKYVKADTLWVQLLDITVSMPWSLVQRKDIELFSRMLYDYGVIPAAAQMTVGDGVFRKIDKMLFSGAVGDTFTGVNHSMNDLSAMCQFVTSNISDARNGLLQGQSLLEKVYEYFAKLVKGLARDIAIVLCLPERETASLRNLLTGNWSGIRMTSGADAFAIFWEFVSAGLMLISGCFILADATIPEKDSVIKKLWSFADPILKRYKSLSTISDMIEGVKDYAEKLFGYVYSWWTGTPYHRMVTEVEGEIN